MVKRHYHPDGTLPTRPGTIFVFGSNQQGVHGAGAARIAVQKFGAKRFFGIGMMGESYGIPTRDYHFNDRTVTTKPLDEIKKYIEHFVWVTQSPEAKEYRWWVTAVGCGLAGFTAAEIAPLFKEAVNCSFPEEWKEYLEGNVNESTR